MALTTKRIIALPSQSDPQEGDYLAIDNATSGTHKIPVGRIGVEVDDTLTEAGKAADAKATGDAIDELRTQLEVTGTASGAIATFTDGSDNPMKSCIVNIEPKQSGTGTPSPDNVRAISGWESVSVNVTGVNVWDEEWELGGISDATGLPYDSSGSIRCKNYIPVLPNTSYYYKSSANVQKTFYDADKGYIGKAYGYNSAFTTPSNAYFMKIAFLSAYGTTYKNDTSINYPSTDTEYHTYNPNSSTKTVNLGRTVYGGTLNVVGGVLTDKMGVVTFNGSETWLEYDYNGQKSFRTPVSAMANGTNVPVLSDKFAYADYAWAQSTGYHVGTTGQYLYLQSQDISTVSDWKTWLGSNNTTVVFPLETPQTYQLTPTEVNTLLGENNVWADSGDVEVVYIRDLNITINNLLSGSGTRSLGMMAMSAPTEATADEQSDEQSDEDMR